MLPALPTGIASASGGSPSSSTTSNAAVFWPSIRYGLTELTSSTGWFSASSRTISQRLVEVAAQGDHPGAVDQRLGELADRDLALGHDHRPAQPGAGRVGGGARRGVAGRGADHRLGAGAGGARDGDRHPAVLEAAGRVRALELEQHPGADPLGDHRRLDQRGRALVEGDHRVAGLERQPVAVALDQRRRHRSGERLPRRPGSRGAPRAGSRARRSRRAPRRSRVSGASCRTITSRASSPRPRWTTLCTEIPLRPRTSATRASTPGRSATSRCR